MIEAITSRDPLDPSATEWTPRRTATDPPPRTYVPVKDRVPPDPTNGKRRRRHRRRKTNTPPQNSAAAQTDISPAVPPPKLVEQTCTSSASSPPTIVEQATPLPTSTATKPHHPPSTIVRTPEPTRCRLLSPPLSVEPAFPMLPPRNVESIETMTYTPVENTSTSPPLNYIHFPLRKNTSSNYHTVSSSSTNASQSRRRHLPRPKNCRTLLPSHPLQSPTTLITDDQIYQLAPAYFRLHPDIYHTICEHNMSFNDFAVTHPLATTTMSKACNEPTMRSMFTNYTFIDTNTPLPPKTSTSSSVHSISDSSSASIRTYFSGHSVTTTHSHFHHHYHTDEQSNNKVSTYSNNYSKYFSPSSQHRDD